MAKEKKENPGSGKKEKKALGESNFTFEIFSDYPSEIYVIALKSLVL